MPKSEAFNSSCIALCGQKSNIISYIALTPLTTEEVSFMAVQQARVTIRPMPEIEYQSSDDRKYERGPKLRKIFGPSQAEVWNLLAEQIGGDFKKGEWFNNHRVDAQVGQWIVTLDTYAVSTGR